MCRLIERCCGSLHASTSAEWLRHDSGSCSQTGSGPDAGDRSCNDFRQQPRDLKGSAGKGRILATQKATELRRFGDMQYVIDSVAVGFTRELGPLPTAIAVGASAGTHSRSGTEFA